MRATIAPSWSRPRPGRGSDNDPLDRTPYRLRVMRRV
jgi:hypothetical protein